MRQLFPGEKRKTVMVLSVKEKDEEQALFYLLKSVEAKSIPSGEIFCKDMNILHMQLHTYFIALCW